MTFTGWSGRPINPISKEYDLGVLDTLKVVIEIARDRSEVLNKVANLCETPSGKEKAEEGIAHMKWLITVLEVLSRKYSMAIREGEGNGNAGLQ